MQDSAPADLAEERRLINVSLVARAAGLQQPAADNCHRSRMGRPGRQAGAQPDGKLGQGRRGQATNYRG